MIQMWVFLMVMAGVKAAVEENPNHYAAVPEKDWLTIYFEDLPAAIKKPENIERVWNAFELIEVFLKDNLTGEVVRSLQMLPPDGFVPVALDRFLETERNTRRVSFTLDDEQENYVAKGKRIAIEVTFARRNGVTVVVEKEFDSAEPADPLWMDVSDEELEAALHWVNLLSLAGARTAVSLNPPSIFIQPTPNWGAMHLDGIQEAVKDPQLEAVLNPEYSSIAIRARNADGKWVGAYRIEFTPDNEEHKPSSE